MEKDTEKRSTTSKRKHCKCQDDMDMDTFFEYQKEASSLKKGCIKESKEHNKEVEKIEKMKADAYKWESKKKELAYKKQLIAEYEKLKKVV